MIATRIAMTALALICATAGAAQTHAELLEKAIFTDETAGDLPGAIRIYERLLTTPGVSREIAARAQTRLAEGRRRRDPHAVARPDAARAAAQAGSAQGVRRCCGPFSENYDPSRPVAISGTVAQMSWVNPQTSIIIEGFDGNRWGFTLVSPNTLLRSGVNRETFKPGDPILITGYMARGETLDCPAALPNACATLQNGALHGSATTITGSNGMVLFDRPAIESADTSAR
jgi:hypothetical protein